jgi:hypothetical protein
VNRRSFLAVMAGTGALGGLGGCLGLTGGGDSDGGPVRLQGYDFEVDVDRGRERAGNPTVVAFDETVEEVRATGFAYYGSSSCDTLGVRTVAYDPEDDRLRATVEARSKNGPLGVLPFDVPLPVGCTADMAGTTYRLTARFEGGLPDVVEVIEDARGGDGDAGGGGSGDHEGSAYAGDRTVVRADQSTLCSGPTPETRTRRAKRHWTCPERYLRADESIGDEGDDD